MHPAVWEGERALRLVIGGLKQGGYQDLLRTLLGPIGPAVQEDTSSLSIDQIRSQN